MIIYCDLDDRPFKCEESLCKAAFVTNSELNEHMKTKHFDVKRYICNAPGKIQNSSTFLPKIITFLTDVILLSFSDTVSVQNTRSR